MLMEFMHPIWSRVMLELHVHVMYNCFLEWNTRWKNIFVSFSHSVLTFALFNYVSHSTLCPAASVLHGKFKQSMGQKNGLHVKQHKIVLPFANQPSSSFFLLPVKDTFLFYYQKKLTINLNDKIKINLISTANLFITYRWICSGQSYSRP